MASAWWRGLRLDLTTTAPNGIEAVDCAQPRDGTHSLWRICRSVKFPVLRGCGHSDELR
eukprot:COSAG06_NODE_48006_length_335_cov_0.860169_1_plen_58_part_10